MNKDIYLTDKQYKSILLKIKKTVDQEGFQYTCFDSTTAGDKYTESNCGLCNNNFTEKDTALFPDQFPERKSMKYRLENHKCPLDMRVKAYSFGEGCFYHCCLFQNVRYRKKKISIDELREMVNIAVQKATKLN